MSQSLAALEAKRHRILQQLLTLGDLRAGTVSANARRCGKPTCHCAQPGDPGHPQFRLTRKYKGHRKAAQEVAEFHRFQRVSAELVAVNEQICRQRPVEPDTTGWTEQEKKPAAAVHQEVAREIHTLLNVIFTAQNRKDPFDFEAVESLTRTTVLRAGSTLLSSVVENALSTTAAVTCECGHAVTPHDQRTKQVMTVLGAITIQRPYYRCPACGQSQIPHDQELDIAGTKSSPGLRRMMAVVGSETSFEKASEQVQLLAGIAVIPKAIQEHAEAIGTDIANRNRQDAERAKQLQFPEILQRPVPILYIEMDGTGIPVVKAETEGRVGRQQEQPARTREVKLGCVFTQTKTGRDGRPLRDPDSTTYGASIETAEEFGHLLYTEAWRRGWNHARQKVVIADGALCNWTIADRHFPGAIQIVDLYHARQHLWELAGKLFPSSESRRKGWATRMQGKLDQGEVDIYLTQVASTGSMAWWWKNTRGI